MAHYSVVAADGQRYGPVDDAGLAQWAREGRVADQTQIYCHETDQTTDAHEIAALAGIFPRVAPAASPTTQGIRVAEPATPGLHPLQHEAPLGYAPLHGKVFPNGHELSDFPVVGIVLLDIFVPIFSVIWFNLMHGKMNRNRPDDPGAGAAIGFCFIPLFNVWYWDFFTFRRLVVRVNEQRINHGLAPAPLDGLAIALCVLWACFIPLLCVPVLNLLWILAVKVVSCVFFARVQQAVNELVIATRVRGFAVLQGAATAPR